MTRRLAFDVCRRRLRLKRSEISGAGTVDIQILMGKEIDGDGRFIFSAEKIEKNK